MGRMKDQGRPSMIGALDVADAVRVFRIAYGGMIAGARHGERPPARG